MPNAKPPHLQLDKPLQPPEARPPAPPTASKSNSVPKGRPRNRQPEPYNGPPEPPLSRQIPNEELDALMPPTGPCLVAWDRHDVRLCMRRAMALYHERLKDALK